MLDLVELWSNTWFRYSLTPGSLRVSGVKGAVRADSEEAELSSNMTLHWSDDDDDVTVNISGTIT